MKSRLLLLILLLLSFCGCQVTRDKLYIFKISHPPVENDWKDALSYSASIEKGSLNQSSSKLTKLDKETIHASNKTCHHVDPTTPVEIKLSAFYDEKNFYLRVQWPDKNKNDESAIWNSGLKSFDKTKGHEDGLGIIWDLDKKPASNCLSKCHLNDWLVQDARLNPIHQMKSSNQESSKLWMWWAGRNSKDNSIWKITLDSTGIDENKFFLQNTGKTPNIYSRSSYEDGLWTLTITSPLINPEKEFTAGNSYQFQIAVFQNTYSDHSITSEIQEMIFVNKENMGLIKIKGIDL